MTYHVCIEFGTPTFAVWCPRCLLPSVIEADVWGIDRVGLTKVGRWSECQKCQRKGRELDDPSVS